MDDLPRRREASRPDRARGESATAGFASPAGWLRVLLASGTELPQRDWERHHGLVLWLLALLSVLVPLHGALRGSGAAHAAGHMAPLAALTAAAAWTVPGRAWREAAAALGLMVACALVVHSSHGATEAHFLFFALLPLTVVYGTWTPFGVAVGFVLVHHFALGTLVPGSVFDHPASVLGMAWLHAGFVLVESLVCLTAWRVHDDRRARVEHLVAARTAELQHQQRVLARLAAVVESTDDAVVVTEPDGVVVTWNPGAERLYGFTAEEAVGRPIGFIRAGEGGAAREGVLGELAEHRSVRLEDVNVRKDGTSFEALATISGLYDADRALTGVVAITRDISERKRSEAEARAIARTLEEQAGQLTRLAWRDPLTGLANRASLVDRLERVATRRGARCAALLLLDLDNFKTINDVHGHATGDEVLVEVARRLQACVRPGDMVARLGGDEFVVLLSDVEGVADADAVTARVLAALATPVAVGAERFEVGASIGLTLTDAADPRGVTELLRDADTAMYAAKRSGRTRVERFEAGMHDELVAQTSLANDLRRAVAAGQLRVLYQPQVDLESGRITGVEALVRWQHPEHGLLAPDRFIPLAETTGAIVAIDDWVLGQACAQLRAWDDAELAPLRMAVNVSARRLVAGRLADTVAAATRAAGIDAARLEVEITEGVAVEHEDAAVEAISGVRALGAQVAIDDFGMGHSALSRLQCFPVDRLKIDRAFVAPLAPGLEHGSIADAMVAIGRSLGLQILAEGVETGEHLRALRSLGCTTGQGYLFSEPVAPAEIERMAAGEGGLVPPGAASGSLAGVGTRR